MLRWRRAIAWRPKIFADLAAKQQQLERLYVTTQDVTRRQELKQEKATIANEYRVQGRKWLFVAFGAVGTLAATTGLAWTVYRDDKGAASLSCLPS